MVASEATTGSITCKVDHRLLEDATTQQVEVVKESEAWKTWWITRTRHSSLYIKSWIPRNPYSRPWRYINPKVPMHFRKLDTWINVYGVRRTILDPVRKDWQGVIPSWVIASTPYIKKDCVARKTYFQVNIILLDELWQDISYQVHIEGTRAVSFWKGGSKKSSQDYYDDKPWNSPCWNKN